MTALLSGCYLSHTPEHPLEPGTADAGDGASPDARSGWVDFGQGLHGHYVFASFANASLDRLLNSCPVVAEAGACRRVQCPGELELSGDAGTIEVVAGERILLSAGAMIPFPGYYGDFVGDASGETRFPPIEDPFVVVRGTGGADVPMFSQSIGVPRAFALEAPEMISRGEDLRVTWTASAGAEEMSITVTSATRFDLPAVLCTGPAAAGVVTVPASLFADLPETSAVTIDAVARVTEVVTAGDYTIAVSGHFYMTRGVLLR